MFRREFPCDEYVSLGLVIVWLLLVEIAAAADAMSVDEVREGMTGYGLTVVKGQRPSDSTSRFSVCFVWFSRAETWFLLAVRVGDREIGRGRRHERKPGLFKRSLARAIAYTWEFGLEPIAGITPYQQMVALADRPPVSASMPIRLEIETEEEVG